MTGERALDPVSLRPFASIQPAPFEDTAPAKNGSWLLVFADLVALLLCLFLLVLSLQVPPAPRTAPGAPDRLRGIGHAPAAPPELRLSPGTDTEYLATVLLNALARSGAADVIDTRGVRGGVLMRARREDWLQGPAGREPARDVAAVLQRLTNATAIRVHVPTALRGRGLEARARLEALETGRDFGARLRSMGFTRPLGVLLGPPGAGAEWVIDIMVEADASP